MLRKQWPSIGQLSATEESAMVLTAFEKPQMSTRHYRVRFPALPPKFGELGEWFMPVALKAIVPQGTGGSNPSLSAIYVGKADTVMAAPVRKTGVSSRPLGVQIPLPTPSML